MYLLGMYCRYRSIIYPYLSYYYRYTWKHLAGVLICLSGLACIVLNDYLNFSEDDSASASSANPLIGDILCLLGAVLYASSNVLQEKLGMCVYVYMYEFMYKCMYVYMHACNDQEFTHLQDCTLFTYIFKYVFKYIYTYAYAHRLILIFPSSHDDFQIHS